VVRRALPLAFVLFAACASLAVYQQAVCDTLYFGTQRPGGVVSDVEWRQFLRDEVTPRYPGFTHWEAHGEWKGAREETHVLQIIHPRSAEDEGNIRHIVDAYKKRFAQEAVLQVRADVWLPR
jgi:hypothetical protein